MNKIERMTMVKAMEFICRNINDETVFENWLLDGVADGDISYGDVAINLNDDTMLECYTDDESFSELMDTFLFVMKAACRSGGLYCDGVSNDSARFRKVT